MAEIDSLIDKISLIGAKVEKRNSFGFLYSLGNKKQLVLVYNGIKRQLSFNSDVAIRINESYIVVYETIWRASHLFLLKDNKELVDMFDIISESNKALRGQGASVRTNRDLIWEDSAFGEPGEPLIIQYAYDTFVVGQYGKTLRVRPTAYYPDGNTTFTIRLRIDGNYEVIFKHNGCSSFTLGTVILVVDKDLNVIDKDKNENAWR